MWTFRELDYENDKDGDAIEKFLMLDGRWEMIVGSRLDGLFLDGFLVAIFRHFGQGIGRADYVLAAIEFAQGREEGA